MEPERRTAAHGAFAKAREAIDAALVEMLGFDETHAIAAKLKPMAKTIAAAELRLSEAEVNADPFEYVVALRSHAAKLRQFGRRQLDRVAKHIEDGIDQLMAKRL